MCEKERQRETERQRERESECVCLRKRERERERARERERELMFTRVEALCIAFKSEFKNVARPGLMHYYYSALPFLKQ